jgi:hypothetical protein
MTAPESPRLELCSAEYTATLVQVPDGTSIVSILAQGVHPTSGYEVVFHKNPKDVYPPEFSLWHLKPSGVALDVVTPFAKFTSFELRGKVEKINIVDASGSHELHVKPISSRLQHR